VLAWPVLNTRQGADVPTEIRRTDVQRLLAEGAQLVEVLPAEEFAKEHLAGAISLPLKTLSRQTAERALRRDVPVVVYCNDAL
jgi:rhodanese-related sulfurtransferase